MIALLYTYYSEFFQIKPIKHLPREAQRKLAVDSWAMMLNRSRTPLSPDDDDRRVDERRVSLMTEAAVSS